MTVDRISLCRLPAQPLTGSAGCGALLTLLTLSALTAPAQAQVRPDAGSTQRDLEQRPLEVPRVRPPIAIEPARPALKADDAHRFLVSAVTISGNTAFASEVLLALVRDELVGKTVTLEQLQNAAAKITAYYRARGYLVARAYVPQQSIDESGAKIEFAVLEGVLGKVSAENRSRLSNATVAGFTAKLKPGAPLTIGTFERPILLLSDQAGVGAVNSVLKAGGATGSSDLTLDIAPAPLASGQLEADNWGSRYTGETRLTGQLNLASPFGHGESFSARVTQSFSGLTTGTLRVAVPVGGDGLKLGAAYGDTRYRLGRNFAPLQASGTAQVAGATLSYPWVRSERWNFNTTIAFDNKRLDDQIASTGSDTPKQTNAASVILGGDVRDPFAANSIFAWSATALSGRLAINSAAAAVNDATTAMTQGSYQKYSISLLYQQALTRHWSIYGIALAQVASKNLDSSEKFALGGAQGVRAYPVGEAAGDQGVLVSAELRYAFSPLLGATPTLLVFVDQGHTQTNKNAFSAGVNQRTRGAAGLGATFVKTGDYSLLAYWAVKTSNEAATADTDWPNRVWVQAIKYF